MPRSRRITERVADGVTVERLEDLIEEYKRQLDRVVCHDEI